MAGGLPSCSDYCFATGILLNSVRSVHQYTKSHGKGSSCRASGRGLNRGPLRRLFGEPGGRDDGEQQVGCDAAGPAQVGEGCRAGGAAAAAACSWPPLRCAFRKLQHIHLTPSNSLMAITNSPIFYSTRGGRLAHGLASRIAAVGVWCRSRALGSVAAAPHSHRPQPPACSRRRDFGGRPAFCGEAYTIKCYGGLSMSGRALQVQRRWSRARAQERGRRPRKPGLSQALPPHPRSACLQRATCWWHRSWRLQAVGGCLWWTAEAACGGWWAGGWVGWVAGCCTLPSVTGGLPRCVRSMLRMADYAALFCGKEFKCTDFPPGLVLQGT